MKDDTPKWNIPTEKITKLKSLVQDFKDLIEAEIKRLEDLEEGSHDE